MAKKKKDLSNASNAEVFDSVGMDVQFIAKHLKKVATRLIKSRPDAHVKLKALEMIIDLRREQITFPSILQATDNPDDPAEVQHKDLLKAMREAI